MIEAERMRIDRRLAMLERTAVLFGRFGGLIPIAIAFLNGWPTEVQLYPHWQLGESWRFFLSLHLYWLAQFALARAMAFAKGGFAR